MPSITLYHNARCSKSRAALERLQAAGCSVDIVNYLDSPPNAAELRELLRMLNFTPRQLLRTGEEAYKTLNLADSALSDEQLLAALCAHPRLIERPIAVCGDKAVVGRPPERVLELLS